MSRWYRAHVDVHTPLSKERADYIVSVLEGETELDEVWRHYKKGYHVTGQGWVLLAGGCGPNYFYDRVKTLISDCIQEVRDPHIVVRMHLVEWGEPEVFDSRSNDETTGVARAT